MATRTKKSTSKKRARPQNQARKRTVTRAAALKKLTKTGGRKRASAKKRVKQTGATGDDW